MYLYTGSFLPADSRTLWPICSQCWCPPPARSLEGPYSRDPSWPERTMPFLMPGHTKCMSRSYTGGKFIIMYEHLSQHSNPTLVLMPFFPSVKPFILCVRFTTLAFSMTLANSPLHMKQCFGVMRRKQSPLFREWAVGSTKRTWMCLRPTGTTQIQVHTHTHTSTHTPLELDTTEGDKTTHPKKTQHVLICNQISTILIWHNQWYESIMKYS